MSCENLLMKLPTFFRRLSVRCRIHRLTWTFLGSAIIFIAASLQAATTNWRVVSGNWDEAANWDAGLPNASTHAFISNDRSATITSNGAICFGLYIGNYTDTQTGTVRMTGGTLSVGNSTNFDNGAFVIDHGSFSLSGGTATVLTNIFYIGLDSGTVGTFNLSETGRLDAHDETISNSGTGYFNQTGGTNTISHDMDIGFGNGSGTYTQSGGTTTVAQSIYIAGNYGSTGTYILKGDGRLSANVENVGYGYNGTFDQSGGSNSTTYLNVGNLSNSTSDSGKYFLSGGTLSSNTVVVGSSFSNDVGTGIFTQSGGTNTISSSLILSPQSGGKGTYNLNGGILAAHSITKGSGYARFNFGNGTLKAYDTLSTSMPMTLTGTGGNANVDTSSGNITLSGILSGPGGLNKLGAGTLMLSANNAYLGDTNVEGGTLSASYPCLNDLASVGISAGATMNLNFSDTDTIQSLYLDGLPMALGTWGSSLSHATHIDNIHFSGTGMLNVTAVPEPSTIALLLTATLGGLLLWRRRS